MGRAFRSWCKWCVQLWVVVPIWAAACTDAPYPDQGDARRPAEDVFFVLCKRVASFDHPDDPSNARFDPQCDGYGPPIADSSDRMVALVERRGAIVSALDQIAGDVLVEGSMPFADNEIRGFLADIVPLYDPPHQTLPESTRRIAALLSRLLDPSDQASREVIDALATLAPRQGYRPPQHVFGVVRALLAYGRLDELSEQTLGFVAQGGPGHAPFLRVLQALALELAELEPPGQDAAEPSTLHLALELLLTPDPEAFGADLDRVWTVVRGDDGAVQRKGAPDGSTPFVVVGRQDEVSRDAQGRAMGPDGELFGYLDAASTPLAALMREGLPVLRRPQPGTPSPLENMGRGLAVALGPTVPRETDFSSRDVGIVSHGFEGPDLQRAPLLDLVHGLSAMAAWPETADLLRVLAELLREHESAAAGVVFAALRSDELADAHPEAVTVGLDGSTDSPNEFWDDLIAVGQRMADRPGLIEALVRSFADPRSRAAGDLIGQWMRHADVITYRDAPLQLSGDRYNGAQQSSLNTPVQQPLMVPVDRTASARDGAHDVGPQRSIWQTTLSLIASLNGKRVCNKAGAILRVPTSLTVLELPVLGAPFGQGYEECELIEIQDAVELYAQSVIGRGGIYLKDDIAGGLAALGAGIGLTGDVDHIMEDNSQIVGFTTKPTPQSLARFLFAPHNKFLRDLLDPLPTNDGWLVRDHEPYSMFPLEVTQDAARVDGVPQSFITAGVPLLEAFDYHELRTGDVEDGSARLQDGYLFGELLSVLHRHWPSRRSEPCPARPEPGREGCSQNLSPGAPGYAAQTNLVSYEALVADMLLEERLVERLSVATQALAQVRVDGRDGIAILAAFAERVLRSDPGLRARDGRSFTTTNTCVLTGAGEPTCGCPPGTAEAGNTCMDAGRAFPKGRVVTSLSPLYLVLDALSAFDRAFADPAHADRLQPWRLGRSQLVDLLLGAERDPADPSRFIMSRRRVPPLGAKLADWAAARIEAHEQADDLSPWADSLPGRLTATLDHPLTPALLQLLDGLWDTPAAADEFAALTAYLLDARAHPQAFSDLLTSSADLLTFLDTEPNLGPVVRFAALGMAPDAPEALAQARAPDVAAGAVLAGLSVAHGVAAITQDPTTISPLSRLLSNAVQPMADGKTPLGVLFDAAADVNRADPSSPTESTYTADDFVAAFTQVRDFMADPERGLERLYQVIQQRELDQ